VSVREKKGESERERERDDEAQTKFSGGVSSKDRRESVCLYE
jgi:hypothetical protein